ncbi:phosphate ABC transporter permease subunit PstC [Aureimonas sp. AU4]|uniref:phosphate ABC transporter permease subunit PstC n=1 Tax=Aureimonas sp. AU4 TaxID=1638163 RepID=UPI0007065F0F|nr:phosphate ABC transporter permease subunit PstC [Aureimonas sp. AU4]BAT30421.1 phosphate ABC transporter permease [Aureimonas sp. AU4]
MSSLAILVVSLLIALGGAFLGARRSAALRPGPGEKLHSRPVYHGAFVFVWSALPALVVLIAASVAGPIIAEGPVRQAVEDSAPGGAVPPSVRAQLIDALASGMRVLPADEFASVDGLPLNEVVPLLQRRGVAIATATDDAMVRPAAAKVRIENTVQTGKAILTILAALAGAALGLKRIAPRLRARNQVEIVVRAILILCSMIAIVTTIGIILSMLSETIEFFHRVEPSSFFFGTVWDPRFAAAGSTGEAGQFGLIPLLAGTLYIAFVAMLFAVPVGLFAAIYMAEYAKPRTRSVVKPLLEVLAGIPTIVYGFFALVTVGPFLRDVSAQINGLVTGDYTNFIQAQSILTAGLVMGIMLIPFVSSLSDDIITAVPRSLRDGSLGLGATRSETIKRVVLPAALPGIVSALLLTASRAIGETMIVVLAAGVAARLTLNPFEAMTTVTVKIVNQLTGDLEFNSPQTLVAFALGITLFVITLGLNIIALSIVRKYREQYE